MSGQTRGQLPCMPARCCAQAGRRRKASGCVRRSSGNLCWSAMCHRDALNSRQTAKRAGRAAASEPGWAAPPALAPPAPCAGWGRGRLQQYPCSLQAAHPNDLHTFACTPRPTAGELRAWEPRQTPTSWHGGSFPSSLRGHLVRKPGRSRSYHCPLTPIFNSHTPHTLLKPPSCSPRAPPLCRLRATPRAPWTPPRTC